jgi:predicted transglutaminase-like cysteine proteinase
LYQAHIQQWALRLLAGLVTLTLFVAVFGVKPAKANSVRDIPAQMSLVSVANAAFGPVESYPALFGADERRSANLKPFSKWTGMFDRFERDIKTTTGQEILGDMKAELAALKGMPLPKMAERINTMMNRIPYITDDKNWGVSDYWATPVEFMKRGGDCEDYAIAKYTALRALGVPEERLRIAIVHDLQKNIPHAILIVYTDEGAMVLDNQTPTARYSHTINRYKPIFSINRTGWWLHSAPKDTILAAAQ